MEATIEEMAGEAGAVDTAAEVEAAAAGALTGAAAAIPVVVVVVVVVATPGSTAWEQFHLRRPSSGLLKSCARITRVLQPRRDVVWCASMSQAPVRYPCCAAVRQSMEFLCWVFASLQGPSRVWS